MKRLLLGATALTMMTGAASADFTLNILHINDFHARFQPITSSDSNCDAETDAAGECFGGIGRLITALEMRRGELGDANVVLLDAGDWFQGSLFYSTYKSEVIAEFTNMLGIDAMAVGNHEFDDGPEELAAFLDAIEYPLISGNTNVTNEPLLAGKLPGVQVLEVGGERIGIVSALAEDTDETSSPGENVVFEDTINSLRAAVQALEAAGINKIIALTHVGYTTDQEIAANVPGIDVIVGGHSHTLLSNTEEGAAGSYPTMVTGPMGTEVPIVQAYSYGKYLGELEVTWDDDGNVTAASGDPLLLDASIEADADADARIAELQEPINELMEEVIGTATAPIDGSREVCRADECTMGNLVADAMLDRVADQFENVVAIQNGGGLRASIDEGEITMGEVLTVLPFSNTLATVDVSGADVIEALENGVSDVENGAGRFPQVAGLQYSWDISQPVGSRISDVMVDVDGSWAPIDEEATYTVVTNNYMRGGGDGYATFASGDNAYDFGPPLEQVLADYIAELGGEYTPATDGRITTIQ